ncbi:MAG: hypothetical protein ACOYT8_01030 [Candidatus Dependentiae bacterium]
MSKKIAYILVVGFSSLCAMEPDPDNAPFSFLDKFEALGVIDISEPPTDQISHELSDELVRVNKEDLIKFIQKSITLCETNKQLKLYLSNYIVDEEKEHK